MRKSYNAFKMAGSYVGLLGGLFYSYLSLKLFWLDFIDLRIAFEKSLCGGVSQCASNFINIPSLITHQYLIYGLAGFLIGWGIHSLLRKFRRRR